nr:MAG TPA_asm: hypothetical protein [Bacteriophage sp.]
MVLPLMFKRLPATLQKNSLRLPKKPEQTVLVSTTGAFM